MAICSMRVYFEQMHASIDVADVKSGYGSRDEYALDLRQDYLPAMQERRRQVMYVMTRIARLVNRPEPG